MDCDDGLKSAFKPDTNTSVTLVKLFKAGDAVTLPNTAAGTQPVIASVDICLVKLLVGPGKPGSPNAPSTSAGIGIEVWLPPGPSWNQLIRSYGSTGWGGGYHTDLTRIGDTGSASRTHLAAVGKGYVVSSSDHGHDAANFGVGNGSFAMNEDGSINTVLWQDFSERSMHEMAVKTKALTRAFYGKPQKYAYWDGFSTGGRQGYKSAQKYAGDYDGILAGAPAINWTRFNAGQVYIQNAMRRDLGGVIAAPKLNAVSAAATAACGGAALGFLLDPMACRYDPSRDAAALCSGAVGNGGVVGRNTDTSRCLRLAEATVINKIWYGQTTSGSAPDPAVDNAGGPTLATDQLWYGTTRGTNLTTLAGGEPFPIATTQLALSLQNPRMAQVRYGSATPIFTNATGNGADGWRNLSYAELANASAQGIALQNEFANINTDNPDLSALRDRGGKVLSYHGLADDFIMAQGSVHYYNQLAGAMGGEAEVQKFNRLFMIPGLGHDEELTRPAAIDPASGSTTAATKVPLPQSAAGRDELFTALRNWVEKGEAPARIELSSANSSVSMPVCPFPQKATYSGTGPVTAAASYACQ